MSMLRNVKIPIVILCLSVTAYAEVPKQINHQGVVSVNGVRFDGTGLFKFAIVDPDTGTNLWSSDGSITGGVGGTPTAAVSLTVANGVYSVALGDTTLTNMTEEISPSVFNDDNAVLRIWFDDGVNGNQQLTPDHKLTTAPYAHVTAIGVPVGTIVAYAGPNTPSGWLVCDGSAVSRETFSALFAAIGIAWGHGDAATTFNLPDLRGRFLRGVDNGAGNDSDSAGRTASNPGGNMGDNIGSFQDDNIASHIHQAGSLAATFQTAGGALHWRSLATPPWSASSAFAATTVGEPGNTFTFGSQVFNSTAAASGSFGAEDNRPVNCYVNYIIKQ